MARFQKHPEFVEATQWFPGMEISGVCCWKTERPHVMTPAGQTLVASGDWVVQDNGDYWVYEDDQFRARFSETTEVAHG